MPLKRVIGIYGAVAINIGAIIGAGIFVISGLAAGIAGPATIAAIAVGAAIAVLTGLSFAQLSHSYSGEGGNYEYSKRLLGKYPGFVVGLMFVVSSVVSGALVALSFGSYFTSLFGTGIGVELVAASLIGVLGLVNYLGIRSSADASIVLTVIKVAVLAIFIVAGAFFIRPGNYVPFAPNGLGSMFTAAALVFFAYTGFARVTSLGEEVRDPKRTIPRSILYSIVVSAVIYVLVMVVLIGIVPYGALAGSQSPLSYAIRAATGNALLGYVVAVGALFATVNVVLSMILGVSRVMFAMARDGNLPGPFRHLNRFGTPDTAVILMTLLMMAAVSISFEQVASLSNATALVGYSIANFAAVRLTLRKGDRRGLLFRSKYFALVPIAGIASALSLVVFLTAESVYATLAALAAISLCYAVVMRKRKDAAKGRRVR